MVQTDTLTPGTFRRSLALFRAFRLEQTEPDTFYGLLANDSATQVEQYVDLADKDVLDVGGGPGYFADAFRDRKARYFAIDADLGELSARFEPGQGTIVGSGTALPIRSDSIDVCYSSNVLEHVDDPERMAAEMVRVTRPGGTVFLAYTTWLSPWGGHETAPWHYLGGHYAARRYERKHGKRPKNVYGESLFTVSVARMMRWARSCPDVEIVTLMPRYHPSWARWVVHVPLVRELAVWNLALVLRVR